MKNFRFLSLVLALLMSFTMFAACGSTENTDSNTTSNQAQSSENTVSENTNTQSTATENTNSENTNDESTTDMIINDDGEVFTASVAKIGQLKEGAESLDSDKFELAGTTYTFPIKMSELFDNGWNLSKGYVYTTEFKANTKTNLISYYLVHESGMKIDLDQLTNDSDETKDIKDCMLTKFSIQTYDLVSESDFAIPGGIVPMSTAANVLAVFGNPNTTTEFTGYSYNLDEQLTYSKHINSNISYSFTFKEDGTIYSIHIGYDG